MGARPKNPSWDKLFETASGQEGLFTTEQAAAAGYSSQLLLKHVRGGKVRRLRRGVYRLVHFPAGEHEDLALAWLWSGQKGVFSHDTALALHELSDVLPSRVHLSVPASWRGRRIRVPSGLVLHYSTVSPGERSWVGPVPVTDPGRTLLDCALCHLAPDLIAQALRQAKARGLLSTEQAREIARAAGSAEVST